MRRRLHRRVPIELRPAIPHVATAVGGASAYKVTITGGGKPFPNIDVMLYLRDPSGPVRNTQGGGKGTFVGIYNVSSDGVWTPVSRAITLKGTYGNLYDFDVTFFGSAILHFQFNPRACI